MRRIVGALVLMLLPLAANAQVPRVQYDGGTPAPAPLLNVLNSLTGGCTPSGPNGPSCTVGLPDVVAAGSYGSASTTLVVTLDAKGRITAVTPTTIAIAQGAITGKHAGTDLTADLEEEGQVGAVNIGGSPGDDRLLIGDSGTGATWRAIADCIGAGGVLRYGTGANGSGLQCHTLGDADIPDTITINLAAAATALQNDPPDCVPPAYCIGTGTNAACVCATPGFFPMPTPTTAPPGDCDAANEVGRLLVEGDDPYGQTLKVCADLKPKTPTPVATPTAPAATLTPTATPSSYGWVPAGTIRIRNAGGAWPGDPVDVVEVADLTYTISTNSRGQRVAHIAAGPSYRMENEALGCGDLPQNIQCVNGVPKTFGASNQASAGYYATKRCIGGTNSGATCTANSECPGTASVGCDTLADHFEILSSRVYAGDGLTLPFDKPFFVQNMPTRVRATQLQGHWVSEAADIPSTASNERRILGCARARPIVINEICCVSDVAFAGLTLRRDGPPPTPAPTIALPTPAACATPNPNTTGAGCTTTGLPLTIPQNACVSYTITTATGLNALTVTLNGTITDE